ncbi:uncharacterized protein HKW66_Vig0083930 [Vigna angularis]|uniref:Uncharacterized protein n=1 Tax=Phaseolus angularis TaxID=3914 RepID=A0A8T0KMG5_PHAAN|nr:uncharacterized protein HKW66_Vig0083930 [Vigna angularis]
MIMKCKRGSMEDDDDDVCEKGIGGGGFEKVMMMMMMMMVVVEKGEREWKGGEHDDCWCCVMSKKGWRKIQGSLCHPSLISKKKRVIGMCLVGRKLSGISWWQLFHAPSTLVAKEKEI